MLAASPGLEPRLTESESAVLPLDDEAIRLSSSYIRQKNKLVKHFVVKFLSSVFCLTKFCCEQVKILKVLQLSATCVAFSCFNCFCGRLRFLLFALR